MGKPRILIFASGSLTGGGSGFENLARMTHTGILDANIVGVVSHHPREGGVGQRAARLHVPFIHFKPPWNEERYRQLAAETGADFFLLSGWLKYVVGLDPASTFNIHPGNLPRFGGGGMHGMRVHEATMDAFTRGEVHHSAVCMHFIRAHDPDRPHDVQYDTCSVFLRQQVRIERDDTPETLAARVQAMEHQLQPEISNLVIHREIRWNGRDMKSLRVPSGYRIDRAAENESTA